MASQIGHRPVAVEDGVLVGMDSRLQRSGKQPLVKYCNGLQLPEVLVQELALETVAKSEQIHRVHFDTGELDVAAHRNAGALVQWVGGDRQLCVADAGHASHATRSDEVVHRAYGERGALRLRLAMATVGDVLAVGREMR